MRHSRSIWAVVTLTASIGFLGGQTCDNPLPVETSTPQPAVAHTGMVKLRIRNLSGLPASVEEIYASGNEQVRLTQRVLPPSGPESIAEGVWTLTQSITVRAKVGQGAVIAPSSSVQIGDLLVARVFRFGDDFSDGDTLDFDILAPEAPPANIIDCNHNGVNDPLDLLNGVSDDCDTNTVPDECQNDSDSDTFIDPCDGCPNDSRKHAPGICGCGKPDTGDADNDGTLDCVDTCTDTDSDGFGDPGYPANTCQEDGCPNDANKNAPGICGCGEPDTGDADDDGILDCVDTCTDTDSDGFGDPGYPANTCPADDCPNTPPDQTANGDGCSCSQLNCDDENPCTTDSCDAGVCAHDDDDDDDGVTNCDDQCANSPPDQTINGDGCSCNQLDCDDLNPCTTDSCEAGVCSNVFADADDDGVCDAEDACPDTPSGEAVNTDGCACSQLDCDDLNPCTTNSCEAGVCSNVFADADDDGVCDAEDACPDTPSGDAVNTDGCACSQLDCDDLNPCTTDSCEAGVCSNVFADADDDGVCDAEDTPPVFTNCPTEPYILNADPGACTANFELPALHASGNCGSQDMCVPGPRGDPPPPQSGCIECDHAGGAFPNGTTTVTCTARDVCGNTATCSYDVIVNPVNEVRATVRLIGVNAGAGKTRCIKFMPLCGGTPQEPVYQEVVFTGVPATGTAVFSLPCQEGCYTCLCAKDEQHSFPDTQLLHVVGDHFETLAPIDLYGGDNNNDGGLNNDDITLLLAQIGQSAINAGCPANNVGPGGANRDADFDLSGTISADDDYAFFALALGRFGGVFPIQPISCGCTPSSGSADTPTIIGNHVIPLNDQDLAHAASADLNADGVFDSKDAEIYEADNGLPNELSSAMRTATPEQSAEDDEP